MPSYTPSVGSLDNHRWLLRLVLKAPRSVGAGGGSLMLGPVEIHRNVTSKCAEKPLVGKAS